jgi:hypothetical protein
MSKVRILVLTSSTGGGHDARAEAFAEHAEWFCQERNVVPVSYWRLDSVVESSVKVDDLGSNFLEQVLAKLKAREDFWGRDPFCGRFPEGGVIVLLGDATRFVLTELDAGVSLKQLRARGGVHVCGGEVQPLSGRMRLHIFERTFEADCGAQCCCGSVYMQRKAAGVW